MTERPAPARIRLFVAADVPEAVLDAIEGAVAGMRNKLEQARWVPKQNQHITLKFIGWIEPARADEVQSAVAAVAAAHQPAPVSVSGFGCFPSARRARVLWAGLHDPRRLLETMAVDLDTRLKPLGVAAEDRAFVPHLTLARFRPPERVDLPEGPEGPGGFEIDHLTLYRSHLSPRGPRYESMAFCHLGDETLT